MLRKISLISILLFIAVFLSSCFDAHEVGDYAYVTTIGIDKGVVDKWRFSFQISDMRSGSKTQGGGEQEKTEYVALTIDAPTFFKATNVLNTSLARMLNFRHTKYLIISREVAERGEFGDVMGPIIRFREIRRNVNVIVSQGTAESFIDNLKPVVGLSMPKMQEGFMEISKQTGFSPQIKLSDFYSSLKSTYRQPIAIMAGINDFSHLPRNDGGGDNEQIFIGERYAGELPRKGGNNIELFGTALFDGDKMVHKLDGYETRIMLMLRGEFERGTFSHNDPLRPDLDVAVDLSRHSKPKVKVVFDEGKPVIYVNIRLDGTILAIQSRINYEKTDMIGYLEGLIETTIKHQADALIDKAKELNVDFLNFGHHVVKCFSTIQEWEKYNWLEKFKDIKAVVTVDAKIRRTGTMIKSSPVLQKGGGK